VSRAVVFAGGGVAGISWMLGLVDGLARAGIDLAGADLIPSTSTSSSTPSPGTRRRDG
jgi:NTE family protein